MDTLSANAFVVLAMVFTLIFLLAQALIVPAFGEQRRLRKQLRQRLEEITRERSPVRLAKPEPKRSRSLQAAEQLPGMRWVREQLAQAGWKISPWRLALVAAGCGVAGFLAGQTLLNSWLWAALLTLLGLALPFWRLHAARQRRIELFDEQLPEALDAMVRALRAGHPFKDTLQLVGREMAEPLAGEFRQAFHDINYGGNLRTALYELAGRVPSLNVTAMVTAILIQKESGGNLSEVLEKLAAVVRGRFSFKRRTSSLSAEARMSAWILTLMPFALFLAISLVNPDYLPMLTSNPMGKHIVLLAFVLLILGVIWMRRIIRIDV